MRYAGRVGFIAGVVGGAVATAAIYLGLFTGGIPAVALALWDRALRLMPMQLFSFLIVRFKFAAKPAAFWGMLLGLVVLWGIVGAVVARWAGRRPLRLVVGSWVAASGGLVLLAYRPASTYLAERLAAEGVANGDAAALLAALAGYGLLLALPYTLIVLALTAHSAPAMPSGGSVTRRQLLSRAVVVVAASAVGTTAAQWVTAAARKAAAAVASIFDRVKGLPADITPNDQFYVVSKNPPGFDPSVDASKWALQVDGLVSRSIRLTYDDVKAMPTVEQFQTLECISNEVGGDLISNAKWKGVRLRDILERAGGLRPTAVKVAFRCADGYTESIPIADAMNATTLLAYEMNGEPLPRAHGFPVRLLVPGLFGMKNPKWITRVEVVDYDFQGYWERSGWSDEAVAKTMSKFTVPTARSIPAGEIGLGGIAYAGDRSIKEVEFSTDGGRTWRPAEIKAPAGPFTWVLWAATWTPSGAGEYTLKVRAKDGLGVLQTARETSTLPDGATGYHTIRIRVGK